MTLLKSVTTPPPYSVGQQVTYSYLLTNTGGSTLFNVAVADNRLKSPNRGELSLPTRSLPARR